MYSRFNSTPSCLYRQVTGYQGRTNKEADSCYAFWVGASLKLLGCFDCTDFNSTRQFLLSQCQYPAGGFAKYPGSYPDILHSYYSLCWLSLSNSLKELDPDLAICADKVTAWNKSSPN